MMARSQWKSKPAMSEFHYVWNAQVDPTHVREKYCQLTGDQPLRIQYTGESGATLEWSISETGLQRWKIIAYDVRTLEALERLLRDAFGPVARHEVRLHPVYQEGDHFVGWVLWMPK